MAWQELLVDKAALESYTVTLAQLASEHYVVRHFSSPSCYDGPRELLFRICHWPDHLRNDSDRWKGFKKIVGDEAVLHVMEMVQHLNLGRNWSFLNKYGVCDFKKMVKEEPEWASLRKHAREALKAMDFDFETWEAAHERLSSPSMLDRNDHKEVAMCLYSLRHAGRLTDAEVRSISLRNGIDSPQDTPEISKRRYGSELLGTVAHRLHKAGVLTKSELSMITKSRWGSLEEYRQWRNRAR